MKKNSDNPRKKIMKQRSHVWTLLNVTGRTRIMDHQFGCQYLDNNNKEARLPEEVVGSYYEG